MTELLLIIGGIYLLGKNLGDNVGVILTAVLVICLVLGVLSAGRKSDRAYGNFVDYWADGGPRRKR